MLLCGPLWVLCGPLRSFVGPLRSFAVLCGPLRSFAVFSHTGSGGGHEAFQAELESRVETEASASWSQLDPRRDWSEASGRLETKANFFSGLVLTYFSLLCADVNCDFVLIFIVYCVILILILYCTTTYYYVLFHWRYMYVWYVLLNSTYLLTTPVFWDVIDDVTTAVSSKK